MTRRLPALAEVAADVHRLTLPVPMDGLPTVNGYYSMAAALRTETGARVFLGAGERTSLSAGRVHGAHGLRRMLARSGEPADSEAERTAVASQAARPTPDDPDRWLTEGDTFDTSAGPVVTLSTPGHTRGHCSLPGHGAAGGEVAARAAEIRTHDAERLHRITVVLGDSPMSAWGVADAMRWTRRRLRLRDLSTQHRALAVGEVVLHLNLLLADGLVVRNEGDRADVFSTVEAPPAAVAPRATPNLPPDAASSPVVHITGCRVEHGAE